MPLVRNRRSSYIDEGRAGVHRPSLKQDLAKATKLTLIERGSKGKAGGCPPPCTREELEARHTSVHTLQTGLKGRKHALLKYWLGRIAIGCFEAITLLPSPV